jgi:hypothetical protein
MSFLSKGLLSLQGQIRAYGGRKEEELKNVELASQLKKQKKSQVQTFLYRLLKPSYKGIQKPCLL